MGSYSLKKEDLVNNKEKTTNAKGARHDKKMIEEQRKNNKLYGMSDKEISQRANEYESYELPNYENKSKGINHGERRGEKGGRYNQRTSKNGTSYRQYF